MRQYRYDSRGRRDGDRVLALGKANTSDSATGGSRGSSVVAGREYTWRVDSVVTAISDLLAGPIGLDVDELGRVTGLTRRATTDPATGTYLDPWATGVEAQASSLTAGAKAVEEFYSFTTAGVLDRVDPGADFRDTEPTGSGGSSNTGTGAAARGKPENLAKLTDHTGHTGATALSVGGHTAEASAGSASEAVVGVDLDGTLVTRVGRTRLHYDTCGRVVHTVTRRLSRKPLVREFTYGATGQVRGFSSSDDPDYRWVYVYDGLCRRVAKEKIHRASGEVMHRVVFVHDGDTLVGEQTTVGGGDVGDGSRHSGLVWVTDPGTGELLGQITLTNTGEASPAAPAGRWSRPADTTAAATAPQHRVDAVFHAMVTDLASAPRELIDPDSGDIVGRVEQSLYGRRAWHGEVSCPLLFAGQYQDTEPGWMYNRFRYYDPTTGIYNAQDPLGVARRMAGAQGYVDNAIVLVDELGLTAHSIGSKPDIKMGIYKEERGHHVPAKASIKGSPNETWIVKEAAAVPTAEIKAPGSNLTGQDLHRKITSGQQQGYAKLEKELQRTSK